MGWNAANLSRGSAKEAQLQDLLRKYNVDFMAISEADMCCALSIRGYRSFESKPVHSSDNSGSIGKVRAILLVKDELVEFVKPLFSSAIDVWLAVQLPGSPNTALGAVYRQWGRSSDTTEATELDILHSHMKEAANTCKRSIVVGDFNLDLKRKGDKSYGRHRMLSEHLRIVGDMGYTNAGSVNIPTFISTYTREGQHVESVLDHVYETGFRKELQTEVLPDAITDHRPIMTTFCRYTPKCSGFRTFTRRDLKRMCPQALLEALASQSWDLAGQLDPNEILTTIVQNINAALDRVAPVKTFIAKPRPAPLFLGDDTLSAMTRRDLAARQKSRDYRFHRNQVVKLVRRDRLRSNLKCFTKANTADPKKLWALTNGILGRGQETLPGAMTTENGEIKDDNEKAAFMNNFFVSKVNNIVSQLPKPYHSGEKEDCGKKPKTGPRFSFSHVTAFEVAKIIKDLRNTPATGYDGIPVQVLKQGAPILAAPLAYLVQTSLKTGIFPDSLKEAIVTPIFKGKNKNPKDPTSYRPVAILSAISKVLEKSVHSQLYSFLEKNLLPESQWGFRRGRSTTMAIAKAHAEWLGAREGDKVVGIATFDFSSAFDTVNKTDILRKLERAGVSSVVLRWIGSYLTGRTQCTRWKEQISPLIEVCHGVPQGSILGPLLFLVAISDMEKAVSNNLIGYADDSTVYAAGNNTREVAEILESAANKMTQFAATNSLALNAAKTQILWAGAKNPPKINIGAQSISPSSKIDFLGVKLGSNLKFTEYHKEVLSYLRRLSCQATRLLQHIPRGKILNNVIRALYVGKVGYAAAATTIPVHLDQGIKTDSALQEAIGVASRNVARSLTGIKRVDKVDNGTLMSKAGLHPPEDLAYSSIAALTYKLVNDYSDNSSLGTNPLATELNSLSMTCRNMRTTRARTDGLLPVTRKAMPTFTTAAIRLWNSREDIRKAPSAKSARSRALQGQKPKRQRFD